MEITRKAIREGQELALDYRNWQEALLDEDMIEDKLTQLRAFIGSLKRHPQGATEIQRRVKLFGECKRSDGDTSTEFYAKLRHWLDKDFPGVKLPRHAPR